MLSIIVSTSYVKNYLKMGKMLKDIAKFLKCCHYRKTLIFKFGFLCLKENSLDTKFRISKHVFLPLKSSMCYLVNELI